MFVQWTGVHEMSIHSLQNFILPSPSFSGLIFRYDIFDKSFSAIRQAATGIIQFTWSLFDRMRKRKN